ncbi:MAG: ribonuclease Z [bacterium]|nr:ribonuclease Z [bacterium]
MKIKILGSAAGLAGLNRYNASILLQIGSSSYLIDAGEPCSATLYVSNYNIFSIKAVFLSHVHPDHIGGLAQLLSVFQMCSSPRGSYKFRPSDKYKVNLYLPEDSIEASKNFFDMSLGLSELRYDVNIIPIKEGEFFEDDRLRVSAFPNTHLQGQSSKSKTSYSFSFECRGKRIVYTGDIGKIEDIIPLLKDEIDLLITEGVHIPLEDLFSMLSKASIKKVVVTHFHPEFYTQEKKILEIGKRYLNCELLVAKDNSEIKI